MEISLRWISLMGVRYSMNLVGVKPSTVRSSPRKGRRYVVSRNILVLSGFDSVS